MSCGLKITYADGTVLLNRTLVSNESIYYNGSYIGAGTVGSTTTIPCANKYMSGNLVIGGKTVQCANKIMPQNLYCYWTAYSQVLFNQSQENITFYTGKLTSQPLLGTYSFYQGHMCTASGADVSVWRYCYIDLTNWTKIAVNCSRSGASDNFAGLIVSSVVDNAYDYGIARLAFSSTSATTQYLDVSGLSGYYYVGTGVTTNATIDSVSSWTRHMTLYAE